MKQSISISELLLENAIDRTECTKNSSLAKRNNRRLL